LGFARHSSGGKAEFLEESVTMWDEEREKLQRLFARQLTMKGTTMLGCKNYTQEEIDQGKVALDQQLVAYKKLVKAVASATTDKKIDSTF
jgi:predicted mannosyl-3-phosphoglycerate phosphatase (HAD superfamily)